MHSSPPPKGLRFDAAQTRAARGLLNWPMTRLAEEASLELLALELFELGARDLGEDELLRLAAAIRAAGVIPIRANRAGAGVRFRRPLDWSAAQDRRTEFAPATATLSHWLPILESGADAGEHREAADGA